MNIIAFDLGANLGWARNGEPSHAGHILLTGPRAHRQGQLLDYLANLFSHAFLLELVVYETPFARGRDATRSSWGSAGVIEAAASLAGLPVLDVAVATIKKFATGDGRASKDEMILAAYGLGYDGSNEHEADAWCLLKYAEQNAEKVK
jgi:Holliday junction resolvasome RuvABC endonuclease subunit